MAEKHPFKPGDKILCVRAPEPGIPIEENKEYTVKTVFQGYPPDAPQGDGEIPGLSETFGVTLVEAPGHFFAERFK